MRPAHCPTELSWADVLHWLLQIVTRTGKLAYEWRGLKHLPQLLDRLVADQVRKAHHLACRLEKTYIYVML